jgi:threonine/homoserine/homoserine lactone efflux protein
MPGILGYLPIALAFIVVTASPGPANIAVATVAMSNGRRSGLVFAFGLSFGLAFWGVIAATGMGAILEGSGLLLMTLKIVGGFYLLWLAFQSGRSAFSPGNHSTFRESGTRWFIRGLVLNLSNPKSVAAWMAALSMGLGTGDDRAELITATLLCIAIGFLNFTGYALAFSLSGFASGYRRANKWINGTVAGLFAVAGIGLIRSAFSR